jgi:hypothetical protein
MAGSLQDQLLKLGVVDKKKVKQTQQQKVQKNKKDRQAEKSGKKIEPQLSAQQQLEQAQREKKLRDIELNKQRDAKLAQTALFAEVRQIIQQNIIEIPKEADTPYQFTVRNKIKKIYVTPDQYDRLTSGQLAIALIDNKQVLIPDSEAEKVESRLPEWVVRIKKQETDTDDAYADYQIPDDLIW